MGPRPSCAACRFQRRRCTPECPLAPWFPANESNRFAAVHKLFGVSNVLKLLTATKDEEREDLIMGIIYEADARERDPVYGAYGTAQFLARIERELEHERNELRLTYETMLLEEANQMAQVVGVAQVNTLGNIGNMGGGPSPSYPEYSPSTESTWNLQRSSAASHSSSKEPHQADPMPLFAYNVHDFNVSVYTNSQIQQLSPPQQQFHSVPWLHLHSGKEYSPSTESVCNRQDAPVPPAAAHSSSMQSQQADSMPPYTYTGRGSSGSLYSNAQMQQLPPPQQQFHGARWLHLHSGNSSNLVNTM